MRTGPSPVHWHKRNVFLACLLFILVALFLGVSLTNKNSLVLELLEGLQGISTCSSCLALLIPLQALAKMGDDVFADALINICTGLDIQDEDVCQGAITLQAPIIADALRHISVTHRSAGMLCAKVFGLCDFPRVPQYEVKLPPMNRNVTIPTSGRRKPLTFVHLSDVHVDQQYVVGAETRCHRPVCCRGKTDGHIRHPAGPFGNYHCDTPVPLFDSMLKAITQHAPDAQAILFTGDTTDHAVWLSSQQNVMSSISLAYSRLNTLKKPVYAAIGNHDTHPTNSFPRNTSRLAHWADFTFDLHAKCWEPHIGSAAAEAARDRLHASYSVVHPGTNLRIISYNSNYAYKANFHLYDSDSYDPDPNGLFTWMAGQLQEAEDLGQRVWIIGHVSSGISDFLQDQSAVFDHIVQRYHKTIAAQFYGHTHASQFEIAYSDYYNREASTATSVSFIPISGTTLSGNPGFRIYSVDPDSYAVMDFVEMYTNVSDPQFQIQPQWKPYYSAREAYISLLSEGPSPHQPLDASVWHRVTEAFESDLGAFQEFMRRRSGGAFKPKCQSDYCRAEWIMQLRAARSEFNGDALGRRWGKKPWKRSLKSSNMDQHDDEDLPGTGGCSNSAHQASAIIRNIASRRGALQLITQTIGQRLRLNQWTKWHKSVIYG